MDRNTITGFILIAVILLAMSYLNQPSEADLKRQEFLRDSIQQEQLRLDSIQQAKLENGEEEPIFNTIDTLSDSAKVGMLAGAYGVFADAALGEAEDVSIENDLMKVTFSTKGGVIKDVWLKEFEKWSKDSAGNDIKEPLHLLEDKKNRFEYTIPITGASRRAIKTSELYFKPSISGKKITLRADAGNGRYIEQVYELEDGIYMVKYDLKLQGLNAVIPTDVENIELNWISYLDKLELNDEYERNYTSVYFRNVDEDPDNCSCTGDDKEITDKQVQWVSYTQQFFNTTLIARNNFSSAEVATVMLSENSSDLKKLTTKAFLPYSHDGTTVYPMQMYIGPNDFDRLKVYDMELEEIIPFGWGIFRSVNKWIIRPIFSFLSGFIGNAGIVILLLTLIVKLLVYPLTYRMLYSQAKMSAMKPQIEALKKKIGDDQQQVQMKTMEMYRESGVNPLGGCWPMLLQMPLWYALFRFFPASIDFRQESFLWAADLSTYDSILDLGYNIPFYGDHISLFTLLWAGTTVLYSYYNMQNMQMPDSGGVNAQMMKYLQYFMPLMFLFFFNNYAAGLTCYMLFSNVFNIGQTLITKNFIINHDKVAAELEANRKKPKKKGGFQQRLEEAMKQQQEAAKRQQEEQAKKRQQRGKK